MDETNKLGEQWNETVLRFYALLSRLVVRSETGWYERVLAILASDH